MNKDFFNNLNTTPSRQEMLNDRMYSLMMSNYDCIGSMQDEFVRSQLMNKSSNIEYYDSSIVLDCNTSLYVWEVEAKEIMEHCFGSQWRSCLKGEDEITIPYEYAEIDVSDIDRSDMVHYALDNFKDYKMIAQ
jgi:hypothetical protein